MNKKMLFSDYVKKDYEYWNFRFKNIREYADHIGVSHTVIHDMLNGKYNSPSPLTAARMCGWFKLTPEELVELINNADDEFLKEFDNKINGELFENLCSNSLKNFQTYNMHDDLIDVNIVEPNQILKFYNSSISNMKIINTKKQSKYNSDSFNAICDCYCFYKKSLDAKDLINYSEDDSYKIETIYCGKAAIYYLPTRKIKTKTDTMYADENIRDFTNKFFHLITMKKPKYNNYIFLTSSRMLYDEILEYTKGLDIKCSNGVGIGLVCCQYRKGQDSIALVPNNDFIQGYIFD